MSMKLPIREKNTVKNIALLWSFMKLCKIYILCISVYEEL